MLLQIVAELLLLFALLHKLVILEICIADVVLESRRGARSSKVRGRFL